MENFASHSGLSEQIKWSTWGCEARKVDLTGAGDDCEMSDNMVDKKEGAELESDPHSNSTNTTTGPCVTSGGLLISHLQNGDLLRY